MLHLATLLALLAAPPAASAPPNQFERPAKPAAAEETAPDPGLVNPFEKHRPMPEAEPPRAGGELVDPFAQVPRQPAPAPRLVDPFNASAREREQHVPLTDPFRSAREGRQPVDWGWRG